MHVVTRKHLSEAELQYPDAAKEIRAWFRIAREARWGNFLDVRQILKDADDVEGYVIFNIRRNRYRLVTIVHYSREREGRVTAGHIYIRAFLTHKEYGNRANWDKGGEAMSTTLANPVEMIRRGAPRLIRNDEELAEYTRVLFDLTAKSDPTLEEQEAIELLTVLVERYEQGRYPILDAEPVDVLRFLLEQGGLSQRDIAPELGSESTVSLVLAGKRRLNRDHISRLSKRFGVSPAVFFGEPVTLHEAIRTVLLGRESHQATTREISDEIERRGLYSRKDGEAAMAKQINARVRKNPDLFQFTEQGVVRLLSKPTAGPGSNRAA